MDLPYLLYPTKVKELANELITICNDYKSRKIDNSTFKDLIVHYSSKYPYLLYNAGDFNPTIKKIIGKQRISLICIALEGQQLNLIDRIL